MGVRGKNFFQKVFPPKKLISVVSVLYFDGKSGTIETAEKFVRFQKGTHHARFTRQTLRTSAARTGSR